MKNKISFQGVHGAYSEEAAHHYFGEDRACLPCKSFEDVFRNIDQDITEYGIVPIENSLAGCIHQNYDLLLRYHLIIIGEYKLKVSHNLLAHKSATLEQIEKIFSHPQALMQCENNVKNIGETQIFYDTAGSAAFIAEQQDPTLASIASMRAAKKYDLKVLKRNIEDFEDNYTRFLVLGKPSKKVELIQHSTVVFKTSIVFTLKSIPGALHKALSIFAIRDIDLVKIESRPNPQKTWEYIFYVDLIGHADSDAISKSLAHLGEITHMVKILGSYVSGD